MYIEIPEKFLSSLQSHRPDGIGWYRVGIRLSNGKVISDLTIRNLSDPWSDPKWVISDPPFNEDQIAEILFQPGSRV